jgi:transcriptional regulator with XRE-family HTH domain
MSMRLTETERKVAELYARGLRPREIAERLGISINTVYKALSKARKLAAIADKPSLETPHHYVFVTSVYMYSTSSVFSSVSIVADRAAVVVQDLYGVVLRKLDEVLSLLKRQNKGSPDVAPATARRDDAHSHSGHNVSYTPLVEEGRNGHMPEALKRNIWISLLRSKVTSPRS